MSTKELATLLQADQTKQQYIEILGKSAPAFIGNVLMAVSSNDRLQNCEPKSINREALRAAALKLSVDPALAQAYLVPYGRDCQLQISARGYCQLAMRTGRFVQIIAREVYEGEIVSFNPFTEDVSFGDKISDKIVGFYASFTLRNGFNKKIYWSTDKVKEHAEKFSPTYKSGGKSSIWSKNFIAMGIKTVLKYLLRKYGLLDFGQALEGEHRDESADDFGGVEIDVPFVEQEPDILNSESNDTLENPFSLMEK